MTKQTNSEAIKTVAEAFSSVLTLNKKSDEREIVVLTREEEWPDNMPFTHQEAQDAIHNAHGDMLPDDYRYQFFSDAVDAIVANDGDLDAASDEIESDIYTSDLLKWVASNLNRSGYVDEWVEQSEYTDFVSALSGGQYQERQEVFGYVREFLESKSEEIEEDEEEEEV